MNSYARFFAVYVAVESLYGRGFSTLDIERAYRRYLKITGEEPIP